MSDNYLRIMGEDVDNIVSLNLPWERLRNKTILVTGASGFIAAYMVNTFIKLNDKYGCNIRVDALVRNKAKAESRFFHLQNRKELTLLVQDVASPIKSEADIIIHAASPANAKEHTDKPENIIKANIIGTHNIIDLAIKNSAEILLVSSGAVYGNISDKKSVGEDITENSLFNPFLQKNLYALSKCMGEVMCSIYAEKHGVRVKTVRLFSVYGPGDDFYSGRCFNDFVLSVSQGNPVVITGDGSQIRNICYVADAVSAMFTVLLKGDCEPYNIGSTEHSSISAMANEFNALLGDKISLYPTDTPTGKEDRYLPNIKRLQGLGWIAGYDMKLCVKRSLESIVF